MSIKINFLVQIVNNRKQHIRRQGLSLPLACERRTFSFGKVNYLPTEKLNFNLGEAKLFSEA